MSRYDKIAVSYHVFMNMLREIPEQVCRHFNETPDLQVEVKSDGEVFIYHRTHHSAVNASAFADGVTSWLIDSWGDDIPFVNFHVRFR